MAAGPDSDMYEKIDRFLREKRPETPCLVVDLDIVSEKYRALAAGLPMVDIYYAVKANPAPEILSLLVGLGAHFDIAAPAELEACLVAGALPGRLSYGHTIKKERDIEMAASRGVDLFAFDSEAELLKLARAAPGSRVFCRIIMLTEGADWPLSRKFGCEVEMAHDLLLKAGDLGLRPHGVSFHVGSQQTDPDQWEMAVAETAMLFTRLEAAGVKPEMFILGGGFPARYRSDVPDVDRYGAAILAAIRKHFGNKPPAMIIEPGRGLVGDAGVIQSEVVLISKKGYDDEPRWVYLDIGKFGGLPETIGEAIKYRIRTPRDGAATPAILAGPTCEELDVLYEHDKYELPLDLEIGDRIEFLSAGAYSWSYSSVGFNGMPPLRRYFV